jgi:hypothetical protein
VAGSGERGTLFRPLLHGCQSNRQRNRLIRLETPRVDDPIDGSVAEPSVSSNRANPWNAAANPKPLGRISDDPELSHHFLGSHGTIVEIYGSRWL